MNWLALFIIRFLLVAIRHGVVYSVISSIVRASKLTTHNIPKTKKEENLGFKTMIALSLATCLHHKNVQ